MRGEGREGKMEEKVAREIIQPNFFGHIVYSKHYHRIAYKTNCFTCNACKTDCLWKHIQPTCYQLSQRPIRSVFFADTTLALFSARKLLFQRFYVKFSVTTKNVLVLSFQHFCRFQLLLGMGFNSIETLTIFFLSSDGEFVYN